MRLLYFTNARMPTEKAHGWQIAKMCEAFSSSGADVTLFVPKRRNPIKQDAFSYYGIDNNFKIRYLPCIDLVRYGLLGFYIQVFTFTVSAVLVSLLKKSDAIYSRDEVFSWAASLFHKNIFYEMHDYPRSHRWLYRSLFKRVRMVVSTNEIKRRRLVKELGVANEKIIVQSNGVDVSSFRPYTTKQESKKGTIQFEIPADKKVISYIGRYKTFGQSKGVEELIAAFARLRQKRDDIFLMLVGIKPDEQNEVEAIFQRHGLVRYIDYRIQAHMVPHGLMFEYFHRSDVLVMNYPNTEHYAQFMNPIKMFEYMASGTPIVSSDLPSIREVLNETNAMLVAPDDPQALADGISKVLNEEVFVKEIAGRALEDVKKYDWNKRAQNLLAVISA